MAPEPHSGAVRRSPPQPVAEGREREERACHDELSHDDDDHHHNHHQQQQQLWPGGSTSTPFEGYGTASSPVEVERMASGSRSPARIDAPAGSHLGSFTAAPGSRPASFSVAASSGELPGEVVAEVHIAPGSGVSKGLRQKEAGAKAGLDATAIDAALIWSQEAAEVGHRDGPESSASRVTHAWLVSSRIVCCGVGTRFYEQPLTPGPVLGPCRARG